MKAIVKTAPGPGHLVYTDVGAPEIPPGHVLIELLMKSEQGIKIALTPRWP